MVNWRRLKDIVYSLVFMGSLWQLEIAKLNTVHGWDFGFLFSLIRGVNNWAASDFFFLLAIVSFIGVALNGE